MKVRWLRRAKAMLRLIHTYIAAENPRAAAEVVAAIESAAERLAAFPGSGRRGTVDGTRHLLIPKVPYFVVYRVTEHEVQVLQVFHTSQDWSRSM